jgi:hypothetical protein
VIAIEDQLIVTGTVMFATSLVALLFKEMKEAGVTAVTADNREQITDNG